jgi:hypothetical protein
MSSISVHYDSQTTMSKAFSKIYNEKSRHINLKHKYTRQLISDRIIIIVHFRSCNIITDHFTKGLSRDLVKNIYASMRLRPFN